MSKAELNVGLAQRVLETVDHGLVKGLGNRKPGEMCVEAAVCYAMGMPHTDKPSCVGYAVRTYKIGLNDATWSSNQARAKGMRRLAIAQLGSDAIDQIEFVKRLSLITIQKDVPVALRAAAKIHPDIQHKKELEAAAVACENAAYSANAAASSVASSARSAARSARSAVYSAADPAVYSANAAVYSANAAATSAVYSAADSAARDVALSNTAERCVQLLIEMKSPGCEYLYLTEA